MSTSRQHNLDAWLLYLNKLRDYVIFDLFLLLVCANSDEQSYAFENCGRFQGIQETA